MRSPEEAPGRWVAESMRSRPYDARISISRPSALRSLLADNVPYLARPPRAIWAAASPRLTGACGIPEAPMALVSRCQTAEPCACESELPLPTVSGHDQWEVNGSMCPHAVLSRCIRVWPPGRAEFHSLMACGPSCSSCGWNNGEKRWRPVMRPHGFTKQNQNRNSK